MNTTVKILRNDRAFPAGKLANAEVHFIGGDLDGLKLIGFAVWTRRDGNGHNVTFPARPFVVHGEKKHFALLRAVQESSAQNRIRGLGARGLCGTTGRSREAGLVGTSTLRATARPAAFARQHTNRGTNHDTSNSRTRRRHGRDAERRCQRDRCSMSAKRRRTPAWAPRRFARLAAAANYDTCASVTRKADLDACGMGRPLDAAEPSRACSTATDRALIELARRLGTARPRALPDSALPFSPIREGCSESQQVVIAVYLGPPLQKRAVGVATGC